MSVDQKRISQAEIGVLTTPSQDVRLIERTSGINSSRLILCTDARRQQLSEICGHQMDYSGRAIGKFYESERLGLSPRNMEGITEDMERLHSFLGGNRLNVARILSFNRTDSGLFMLQELAESAYGNNDNGMPRNTQEAITSRLLKDPEELMAVLIQTFRLHRDFFEKGREHGTLFGADLKFDDQVPAETSSDDTAPFTVKLVDLMPMRSVSADAKLSPEETSIEEHYQPHISDEAKAILHYRRLNQFASLQNLVGKIKKTITKESVLAEAELDQLVEQSLKRAGLDADFIQRVLNSTQNQNERSLREEMLRARQNK